MRRARGLLSVEDHQLQRRRAARALAGPRGPRAPRAGRAQGGRRRAAHGPPGGARAAPQLAAAQAPPGGPAGPGGTSVSNENTVTDNCAEAAGLTHLAVSVALKKRSSGASITRWRRPPRPDIFGLPFTCTRRDSRSDVKM